AVALIRRVRDDRRDLLTAGARDRAGVTAALHDPLLVARGLRLNARDVGLLEGGGFVERLLEELLLRLDLRVDGLLHVGSARDAAELERLQLQAHRHELVLDASGDVVLDRARRGARARG